MKKYTAFALGLVAAGLVAGALYAQDIKTWISGSGRKPALAVIDFSGAPANLSSVFNTTLKNDLENSALFDMRPKSMFPVGAPRQVSDLRPEDAGGGYALQDWAGAPTSSTHLVFGFLTVTANGVLALSGDLYDVRQPIQSAQMLAQTYPGNPDETGAIALAHKFANDIIVKFGGTPLLNTRIYFASSRGAVGQFGAELWVMDWDGQNQKQLTHLGGQIAYPSVSPDGSRVVFTIWPGKGGQPQIAMVDSTTGRTIRFYNQQASLNGVPNFSPDGSKVYYSSSASGTPQIYVANIDGQGFTRITERRGNPTEPKVNPKNSNSILFVEGSPQEQIYRMNSEGTAVQRVTDGSGEAANPAWNPDGQHFAWAWTRGYQSGDFNIFVADINSPDQYIQLTHSEGRNERPVWAPDGKHIVFASTRPAKQGISEIYTMWSDGTHVTQLTNKSQGINNYPVWGVR